MADMVVFNNPKKHGHGLGPKRPAKLDLSFGKTHLCLGALQGKMRRPGQQQATSPGPKGVIAMPCLDPQHSAGFYETVVGLVRMTSAPETDTIFLQAPDGYIGHTRVVALIKTETGQTLARHHLCLSLPQTEQEALIDWFHHLNHPYQIEHSEWIGWQRVTTKDPDGNCIEVVAQRIPRCRVKTPNDPPRSDLDCSHSHPRQNP